MLQLQNLKHFRHSLKRIVLGGLSGGIGITGILFAVALYVVETLTRPKKRNVFDLYYFSPYELDLPAEAVSFPPLNGEHKVNGWYVSYPGATTTILVCPGYRSRVAETLGISAHLWRAGHNVLCFEYFGHGTDVGSPVTLGYREINDFLGAVAYAKQRTPQNRLGAIGYSMGAAVVIMACARNEDVEALVVDSAFATQMSAIDYNFRRAFRLPFAPFTWIADYLLLWRAGYRFNQVEPLREITRIAPRPILIIHGGKDSIVDPNDAALLYAAAHEPKEIWFLPDADHCGSYFEDRQAYVKKVTDFFDLRLRNVGHLQLVEPTTQESPEQNNAEGNSHGFSEAC